MGKIITQYMSVVNVPCKRCHNIVKARIDEKIHICPHCNTDWVKN